MDLLCLESQQDLRLEQRLFNMAEFQILSLVILRIENRTKQLTNESFEVSRRHCNINNVRH